MARIAQRVRRKGCLGSSWISIAMSLIWMGRAALYADIDPTLDKIAPGVISSLLIDEPGEKIAKRQQRLLLNARNGLSYVAVL